MKWEMHFLTSTTDLAHVVFYTPKALNPKMRSTKKQIKIKERKDTNRGSAENLYEWSAAGYPASEYFARTGR